MQQLRLCRQRNTDPEYCTGGAHNGDIRTNLYAAGAKVACAGIMPRTCTPSDRGNKRRCKSRDQGVLPDVTAVPCPRAIQCDLSHQCRRHETLARHGAGIGPAPRRDRPPVASERAERMPGGLYDGPALRVTIRIKPMRRELP